MKECFHYARVTGQRLVGYPRKNGTTFSDQTGPTRKDGSYHSGIFGIMESPRSLFVIPGPVKWSNISNILYNYIICSCKEHR